MNKKKVIFLTNHFQNSDGVARALVGVVNSLDLNKYDITIKPIFKCDLSMINELNTGIKLEKTFGFYFRGLSKLVKLIPIRKLYSSIVKDRYDIEIAFQCDLPTLLVGASENEKALHVAWMHGYQVYPDIYRKLDKVVCVSKHCADKAKKEISESGNIVYRYNLVEDKKIKSMSNEPIDCNLIKDNMINFISVGRFSPEKGYIRLIHIMNELKHNGYKFRLILIGGGSEYQSIKSEIKKLNLENDIILLGNQVNPHKYTVKSDVFICSSFSEGYSTACTEAAILGVPIITTNVPGGKEIIDTCECGLLTQIDDNSLKSGIEKVLKDENIVNEWKKTLLKTSHNFCYENRKKEMKDLFNEFDLFLDKKKDEKDGKYK